MFTSKDYAKLTGDELVTQEKKLEMQSIGIAFFIGMMLGVIFYAVMGNGITAFMSEEKLIDKQADYRMVNRN